MNLGIHETKMKSSSKIIPPLTKYSHAFSHSLLLVLSFLDGDIGATWHKAHETSHAMEILGLLH